MSGSAPVLRCPIFHSAKCDLRGGISGSRKQRRLSAPCWAGTRWRPGRGRGKEGEEREKKRQGHTKRRTIEDLPTAASPAGRRCRRTGTGRGRRTEENELDLDRLVLGAGCRVGHGSGRAGGPGDCPPFGLCLALLPHAPRQHPSAPRPPPPQRPLPCPCLHPSSGRCFPRMPLLPASSAAQNPLDFLLRAAQVYPDKVALVHPNVPYPVSYTFAIW